MTPTAYKALTDVAQRLHRTVRDRLSDRTDQFHVPTAVHAAARLAGVLMFRSFRLETLGLRAGLALPSDEAERALPRLMDTLLATLQIFGHAAPAERLDHRYMSAGLSRLSFYSVHELLAPAYFKILDEHRLGVRDGAIAAAMATGGLIHDCHALLGLGKAVALASHGLREGLTTTPFPLGGPRWEAMADSTGVSPALNLLCDQLAGPTDSAPASVEPASGPATKPAPAPASPSASASAPPPAAQAPDFKAPACPTTPSSCPATPCSSAH